MKALSAFFKYLFRKELDLRAKIFHMLAMSGFLISVLMTFQNLVLGLEPVGVLTSAGAAALSLFLLIYSVKSGKYQFCYMVTIFAIFFGMFAALFITGGGYHGGMPAFFIFGVVYTVYMLDGKKALFISSLELAMYAALLVWAYYRPELIQPLGSEWDVMLDNIVGMVVVSIVLGATMLVQFRMYQQQQRQLEELNRAKTRFLANASHEMRTPLTVISVNIQMVMGLLKRMDGITDDSTAQGLLNDAQAEIMRLSRMVGGMLSLGALADGEEKAKTDLTAILGNTAAIMRLLVEKNRNELQTEIAENLTVFGSADLLSQVVMNLLQNANNHTQGGIITLRAQAQSGAITVTVADNGSGISPELLPHVFERGVSDGGTGVGLHLCQTVVESHGGSIEIESTEGAGTAVTFTLPVYQGQFGGEDK